jgi:hypothetical protein
MSAKGRKTRTKGKSVHGRKVSKGTGARGRVGGKRRRAVGVGGTKEESGRKRGGVERRHGDVERMGERQDGFGSGTGRLLQDERLERGALPPPLPVPIATFQI